MVEENEGGQNRADLDPLTTGKVPLTAALESFFKYWKTLCPRVPPELETQVREEAAIIQLYKSKYLIQILDPSMKPGE